MLGSALGFGVTLCLPENASRERRLTLAAYGAEVVLTDEMEGTDGAADVARAMAEREPDRFWYADQYGNPDNWRAHYEGTAAEIWDQTGGSISHLVAGLGTTGTLVGTARRLRELAPGVRVVAVEPDAPMHGLEGLKHLPTDRTPDIYDPSLIDECLRISTDEARRAASELAEGAGLFVGPSAGAACAAARRVAAGLENATVVTVLPDGGARYLSEAWWPARERPSPEASLIVARPLLETLHRGLEAAYPGEGCGVLLGEVDGAHRIVREVVPAGNRVEGRNDRYEVDPEVLRELVAAEDRGGPTILGFFHSHPNVDPVPSDTDRRRAWPWYVYLIVRVRESGAAEGRVWTFDADGEPAEGRLSVWDGSDGSDPRLTGAPRGTTASAGDTGPRQET
jgi:cysteine synthase B